MISIGMLIEFVQELEGFIPEEHRTIVAKRLENIIATRLKEIDQDTYRQWVSLDRLRFLQKCRLTALKIQPSLQIMPSVLANYCSHWSIVSRFKTKNNPTNEWRPITPEQNALRVTMLDELLGLDKPKK